MPDDLDSNKGLRGDRPEKPAGGKKCLLTIAIDKYDGSNGYGRLKYPVSNAAIIAEELKRSYGFTDVVSINDHECVESEIRSAISKAKGIAGPDGQLIVYFTGHGAVDAEDGFWIPFDSKKELSENCSVMHILSLLMGKCAQVLLLVDCCFSGTTIDAALPMALFKKSSLERSVFSIITAGSKHDEVPDKSIFFEALFNILRYSALRSFTDLTWQLEHQLELRGSKTKMNYHSIGDHSSHSFLLQRKDCIPYELARSLLEFNFNKQNPYLNGVATFNMTYLRGSRYCGHEIFLYRYFLRNDKDNFPNFNYPVHKISFGGEGNSASYSMWDQLAVALGTSGNDPGVIIKAILNILQHNDFLVIARIKGSCVESEMAKALREFWEKLFLYADENEKVIEYYAHRVYFFIWDVRGNTDDIGNIITEDGFESLLSTSCARLLALPAISEVKKMDFDTWCQIVKRDYAGLKRDERFGELKFDMLSPPRTVMNVIAQIEEVFDKRDAFSELFAINKFSYND